MVSAGTASFRNDTDGGTRGDDEGTGGSFLELPKILSVASKKRTFPFLLIQKGSKPKAELCAL